MVFILDITGILIARQLNANSHIGWSLISTLPFLLFVVVFIYSMQEQMQNGMISVQMDINPASIDAFWQKN